MLLRTIKFYFLCSYKAYEIKELVVFQAKYLCPLHSNEGLEFQSV